MLIGLPLAVVCQAGIVEGAQLVHNWTHISFRLDNTLDHCKTIPSTIEAGTLKQAASWHGTLMVNDVSAVIWQCALMKLRWCSAVTALTSTGRPSAIQCNADGLCSDQAANHVYLYCQKTCLPWTVSRLERDVLLG